MAVMPRCNYILCKSAMQPLNVLRREGAACQLAAVNVQAECNQSLTHGHADFEHSFVAEARSKVIPGFSTVAGVESSAGFLDEKRFLSIRLDMHARVGSPLRLHT